MSDRFAKIKLDDKMQEVLAVVTTVIGANLPNAGDDVPAIIETCVSMINVALRNQAERKRIAPESESVVELSRILFVLACKNANVKVVITD